MLTNTNANGNTNTNANTNTNINTNTNTNANKKLTNQLSCLIKVRSGEARTLGAQMNSNFMISLDVQVELGFDQNMNDFPREQDLMKIR